jgi:hypothetical protein
MTEETTIVRAPRPPIGRIISVVVWGVTDRESPVETDIADAILTATANHGLKPVIASGPYYSDGDEQTREIARLKAALRVCELVLHNGGIVGAGLNVAWLTAWVHAAQQASGAHVTDWQPSRVQDDATDETDPAYLLRAAALGETR